MSRLQSSQERYIHPPLEPLFKPKAEEARAAELRDAVRDVREPWLTAQVGRKLSVLAEADGTGYAENFARVTVPNGTSRGHMVQVTPTAIDNGVLR